MKRIQILVLLIPIVLCLSFASGSLLNKPVPLLPYKTLEGKSIDKNFYTGHVSLMSFMFIGCMPCMNEISTLNKLQAEYKSNPNFQIVCVARQMRGQMMDFNSNNNSILSKVRKAFHADSIEYSIQPSCPDASSKATGYNGNIELKSECNSIEDTYGIISFPTMLYIDKKGIVRKLEQGGPGKPNDPEFYSRVKANIDSLLQEP